MNFYDSIYFPPEEPPPNRDHTHHIRRRRLKYVTTARTLGIKRRCRHAHNVSCVAQSTIDANHNVAIRLHAFAYRALLAWCSPYVGQQRCTIRSNLDQFKVIKSNHALKPNANAQSASMRACAVNVVAVSLSLGRDLLYSREMQMCAATNAATAAVLWYNARYAFNRTRSICTAQQKTLSVEWMRECICVLSCE